MKKRKKGRTLSRPADQHAALMKALLVSLVKYQSIRTTLAKAKEVRPFAEKMLSHAKTAVIVPEKKIAKLRLLSSRLPQETVGLLVSQAELFKERKGGYTRIIKLPSRKNDASPMALIEWVEKRVEKTIKSDKKKKTTAPKVKAEKTQAKKEAQETPSK